MDAVIRNIWNGFATAGWLDQLNLLLGVVGVWLMVKRTLWAFPIGLVAVSVQGVLFWRAHFPADALLQIFFFVALAWGWWHWVRDRGAAPELPVTTLGWRGRIATLLSATAATCGWALWIAPRVGAFMPWRDAFIAAFSVAGQILQSRKNLENWPIWTAVNGVAIVSYWSADLAYTAFLYAIYLALGLSGWWSWWRAMKAQQERGEISNGHGGLAVSTSPSTCSGPREEPRGSRSRACRGREASEPVTER